MARINRGLSQQYKHFSILCTEQEWDRLNYLADGSNKTVSRYIADVCLKADKLQREYTPDKNRVRKSLCIIQSEWEQIKSKADSCELSLTNYIFSVI